MSLIVSHATNTCCLVTAHQFKGFEITIPNICTHKTISSQRTNSEISLSNWVITKWQKSTIYAPVLRLLKTVREVQEILNQPRACQSQDKTLGTGKSELPGHRLIQRQGTGRWYIKSGLWHLAPTKNTTTTWLKVPVHKNIYFYSVRKQFFNNLSGPTSYQHLCRWLTLPSQPTCSA